MTTGGGLTTHAAAGRRGAAQSQTNSNNQGHCPCSWPRARQALAAAREQGARGLLSAMWGLRLTCACCPPPCRLRSARGHCRARATARATASGVSQSPRGGERRRPQPLARASRVPRRSECAPIRSCELEVPGRHLLATAPAAREEAVRPHARTRCSQAMWTQPSAVSALYSI